MLIWRRLRIAKKISAGAPKEVPLGCICMISESEFIPLEGVLKRVS